jgi:hypothetical protein
MSTQIDDRQLEELAAEHELTEEETATIRELLEEGAVMEGAIAGVLANREAAETPQPVAADQGEEPSDAQWKQLGNETARHEKRVREIMGGFVDGFETCEPCQGVGLVPPGEPDPEPKTNELFRTCETCIGFGQVLTGSKAPGHVFRACPNCAGRGYEEQLAPDGRPIAGGGTGAAPPATLPAAPVSELEQAQALESGGAPTFGTPAWMGDPTLGQ